MVEAKKSTQKARLEAILQENPNTEMHKIKIQYTRLDGDKAPQANMFAAKFLTAFSEEEKKLISSLRPGDELVVTKVEGKPYTNKEGKMITPWNLDNVADISTWVDKPKKEWNGGKKGGGGGYDNLGQQIGNSMTNAIASLVAGLTIEQIEERANALVEVSNRVRAKAEVAAGTATKAPEWPAMPPEGELGNNAEETPDINKLPW